MKKAAYLLGVVLPGLTAGLLFPAVMQAQWKIEGPEGSNSFIKIGFLAQGQVEFLDQMRSHHVSQNLFLRRFRILMGGQITDNLSFFFAADSPNLGKYDSALGKKNDGDIFLLDLFGTYSFGDSLKIDGGMMLIPLSHNSAQSAATLLPVDYGPYSFVSTTHTQSRYGRDYGVQLRGYLFEKHLEYRLGVYQGNRDLDKPGRHTQEAPFRYVGRLVVHFLEPEDSFFYTGTTFGQKNIFSLGVSADVQDTYHAYAADLFWDQPLSNGDAFTFQVNYIYYAGDDEETNNPYRSLYPQNDWLIELGYYNDPTKLGLFAQYAEQNFVVDVDDYFRFDPTLARKDPRQDERRYQAGLAYWGKGHNWNLKLAYTVIYREHAYKKPHVYRDQYVLQCQVFMY